MGKQINLGKWALQPKVLGLVCQRFRGKTKYHSFRKHEVMRAKMRSVGRSKVVESLQVKHVGLDEPGVFKVLKRKVMGRRKKRQQWRRSVGKSAA